MDLKDEINSLMDALIFVENKDAINALIEM